MHSRRLFDGSLKPESLLEGGYDAIEDKNQKRFSVIILDVENNDE